MFTQKMILLVGDELQEFFLKGGISISCHKITIELQGEAAKKRPIYEVAEVKIEEVPVELDGESFTIDTTTVVLRKSRSLFWKHALTSFAEIPEVCKRVFHKAGDFVHSYVGEIGLMQGMSENGCFAQALFLSSRPGPAQLKRFQDNKRHEVIAA